MIKRFLNRVVRPPVTWVLESATFLARINRATPICILQMGKVGSSSVYYSLKTQYPGVVTHAHHFNDRHHSRLVRMLYNRCREGRDKLDIISLIREPVGRNVSAFFENFERETGVPYGESNFSIDELKSTFLEKYPHDIPLAWFERHIQEPFGIDVYQKPFPAVGYDTYENGNVRLLVMKMEIPDSDKVDAIKGFLGLESFTLGSWNVGGKKDYAPTYKAFKETVKLPDDYLETMCGSRYFSHFYPKEVIDKVRAKWREETP